MRAASILVGGLRPPSGPVTVKADFFRYRTTFVFLYPGPKLQLFKIIKQRFAPEADVGKSADGWKNDLWMSL